MSGACDEGGAGTRFEHFLVGVDAEGHADEAVVAALELADRLEAGVELVHVTDDAHAADPGERLERLLAERGHADFPLAERFACLEGEPAEAILEHVGRRRADLVVIGSHARHGAFDFGSVERKLLTRSPVPVWSQTEAAHPIDTLVVGVDFSRESDRALRVGTVLAQRIGARLRVMHCFVPPALAYGVASGAGVYSGPSYVVDQERENARAQLTTLAAGLGDGGVEAEPVLIEGSQASERIAAEVRGALTVVGTHGRTGLSRFLLGSVAHGVVRRASPVLVVPPTGRDEGP